MEPRVSYGAHVRGLLTLGMPIVGSHMAQMALHVTDTVLLGRYGVTPLAAVVLGTTSFFVLFIMGSGFGWAVMPMVAAAQSNGNSTDVRRATRMGLWLSLGYGVLILPIFWVSGPIFLALGQDPEVAELAQQFLRIAGFGMLPALIVIVIKSYLAALERTQVALWVTIAGVFVNAALGWALIFGNWGAPELGVRGAAISSLAVQTLCAVLLVAYATLHRPLRRYTLLVRFWRPDWTMLGQVWRLGWPIGLTGLFESGMFTASSIMMGWIGTEALAAHGIAMEISAVAFMVHLGLSNAATIRIGQAWGQGNGRALRDAGLMAITLSGMFGLVVTALYLVMPAQLIGLFLAQDDPARPDIVALGIGLLMLSAAFQMVDAAQVMALGLLRGVQDAKVPMVMASVSYWGLGIPASYVFAFVLGYGAMGIWAGLVVGLSLAAILLMARFWRGAARQVEMPKA